MFLIYRIQMGLAVHCELSSGHKSGKVQIPYHFCGLMIEHLRYKIKHFLETYFATGTVAAIRLFASVWPQYYSTVRP